MDVLQRFFMVGFGGAIGAMARYSVNLVVARTLEPFPLSTFLINILGSFLIGFVSYIFTEKFSDHENVRLLLSVGFLGAFTTFSTFELETFELVRERQFPMALVYISLSFIVGLLAVFGGIWTARRFD